jgi:hypothetical protein
MRRSIFPLLLAVPRLAFADGQRIPLYLIDDWRYWLFLLLYAALTAKVVAWTRRASDPQVPSAGSVAACLFCVAIAYQIAHHLEHVSQIYQWWYLGLPAPTSRGIIFFLDLEWNHFLFDSLLAVMLYLGAISARDAHRRAGRRVSGFGRFLLASAVLVQGWHAVEHSYRIARHVQWGCDPCAGIADQLFGLRLIPLHFWFNVLALTLPLMVFAWFRMDREMSALIRGKDRASAYGAVSS